jgi:hypothetical protein
MSAAARLHSPAAERNRAPLTAALQRLLPPRGVALEVASGSGQHAAAFAAALPGWHWQPSDRDADARASIGAWCEGLPNVRAAIVLDAAAEVWPEAPAAVDAIFCANLIHIAPWAACTGLMRGAARHLAPHGLLLTYGPVLVDGEPAAPGNLAFDADLRRRDPAWGVRRLSDVVAAAAAAGLALQQRIEMPANNLLLVWARPRPELNRTE